MDDNDFSTITRDDLLLFTRTTTREKLLDLLSNAKDEFVKYTHCCEKIESCEANIEKAKQDSKLSCFTIGFFCIFIFTGGIILFGIFNALGLPTDSTIALILLVCVVLSTFLFRKVANTNEMKAQKKIAEYEAQLPDLTKKKEEAMMFEKLWYIPNEYWYEYALSWMFQYVKKGSADSWKEVTKDFDKHWQDLNHQKEMENIAKQVLEESKRHTEQLAKIQIELANRNLSATRWAAAEAWLR